MSVTKYLFAQETNNKVEWLGGMRKQKPVAAMFVCGICEYGVGLFFTIANNLEDSEIAYGFNGLDN